LKPNNPAETIEEHRTEEALRDNRMKKTKRQD